MARWARRLSWRETGRVFQTSWEAVYRSVEWLVQWGLVHRQLRGVESIVDGIVLNLKMTAAPRGRRTRYPRGWLLNDTLNLIQQTQEMRFHFAAPNAAEKHLLIQALRENSEKPPIGGNFELLAVRITGVRIPALIGRSEAGCLLRAEQSLRAWTPGFEDLKGVRNVHTGYRLLRVRSAKGQFAQRFLSKYWVARASSPPCGQLGYWLQHRNPWDPTARSSTYIPTKRSRGSTLRRRSYASRNSIRCLYCDLVQLPPNPLQLKTNTRTPSRADVGSRAPRPKLREMLPIEAT